MTSRAEITPSLLTWARHRRGLGIPEIASKLNVNPDAVLDWEAGRKLPTFRQAQRFAQALYVPFGYLYLAKPPIEKLPLPDFRIIPGKPPMDPSPDLLDLLNSVLGKQQWFREYRESEGVEQLPFVGRFNVSDSDEDVAADIRQVVDVEGARARASNWDAFIRELSRNAESAGIMVMRSGVVGNNNHRPLDVEEFRGFSISDNVAPLIFLNGQDFRGAQIFTLAHEMAHIWSGQGGLSNPDYSLSSESADIPVERFCNRVAAETLVPKADFKTRWTRSHASLELNLRSLSTHYKVSNMVVLRQAYDHGLVRISDYRNAYRELISQAVAIESTTESGGNFHRTLTARNGTSFAEAVVSSAAEGTLLSSEAADLLGVKVKTLSGLAEHLFGSQLNLG